MSWRIFGVLHNIDVKEAFDAEWIAITPSSDPRVRAIMGGQPAAKSLIGGFTDAFGRKKDVSVLLYDDTAPASLRTHEIIRAFHRLYALSSLTYGTGQALRDEHGGFAVRHSSLFDLYPIYPSDDGRGLVTFSAAVRGYDEPKGFCGQASPYLVNHPLIQPTPDGLLRDRLLDAWRRFCRPKGADPRLVRVFRSLDVAYEAASIALSTSVYEYGTRVALWVSAIEVVAHPGGRRGKIDLTGVVDLIESWMPMWSDPQLRACRYALVHKGKTRRVGFASRLYKELYDARNAFLHGNPVGQGRLFPFKNVSRPGLPAIAPLIYEVALLAKLEKLRDKRRTKAALAQADKDIFQQSVLEAALLKVRAE
jgi:hypothetical protein